MWTKAILCLVVCLVPAAAMAEAPQTPECQPGQDCTVIPFDDAEDVRGLVDSPDADLFRPPPRHRTTTLLRIRNEFIDYMVKSVENI